MPTWTVRSARRTAVFCGALLLTAPALAGAQQGARTIAVRGRVEGTDIVRAARRYLGVRYELGGTTPAAFDCSGFVRYVFAEFDVPMPRTAREQAAVGEAPFPGELEPGDLLFFYGGQGAQHIAIYVGGDTIVHASSRSRRVKLDRLGGTGAHRNWFGQRLIAVRRVAPVEGVFRLPAGGPSPLAATAAPSSGGALVAARGAP
jgi:cell wall-associated NlpC family hydrolase